MNFKKEIAEIPKQYLVNKIVYKCQNCGERTEILFPNGPEIMLLKEEEGTEIKWYPVFTKRGYFYMFEKINAIPRFRQIH